MLGPELVFSLGRGTLVAVIEFVPVKNVVETYYDLDGFKQIFQLTCWKGA